MKLTSISPSKSKYKKYQAKFSDGTTTTFGAKGYSDYTSHKDDKRKASYLARHKKNENWNDPLSRGALSRWILWNKPTLSASYNDYLKKFNLLKY